MANAEILLEFLESRSPQPICDDCCSSATGIEPRQQVNQLARRLEGRGLLVRGKSPCGDCGSSKTCNSIADTPSSQQARVAEARVAYGAPPLESSRAKLDICEMRDHIVRFARELASTARPKLPDNGATRLIASLREAEVVPPHQVTMMLTVCGLRNSYSYDKIQLGPNERSVAEGAWAIIEAWAVAHRHDLWRLTTR